MEYLPLICSIPLSIDLLCLPYFVVQKVAVEPDVDVVQVDLLDASEDALAVHAKFEGALALYPVCHLLCKYRCVSGFPVSILDCHQFLVGRLFKLDYVGAHTTNHYGLLKQ